MRLKFLAIVLGGFLLSTSLMAAETKEPAVKSVIKKTQKHPTAKDLKKLDRVRQDNDVFDNYSTGGTAFEPY
jgi:uncharacterized protein (DUF4415 family)